LFFVFILFIYFGGTGWRVVELRVLCLLGGQLYPLSHTPSSFFVFDSDYLEIGSCFSPDQSGPWFFCFMLPTISGMTGTPSHPASFCYSRHGIPILPISVSSIALNDRCTHCTWLLFEMPGLDLEPQFTQFQPPKSLGLQAWARKTHFYS
jgi:hypothetical protein